MPITKESQAKERLLNDLPFFRIGTTAKIKLRIEAVAMNRLVTLLMYYS